MSEKDTSRCKQCEKPPKGVTMRPDMDGWSCPYCGHYNEMSGVTGGERGA